MPVFSPREKQARGASNRTIHIAIMVDTQAILRNNNIAANNVIFMVDDNGNGTPASTGEGGFELHTACNPGDQISWKVFSINGNDSIIFTDFRYQGNVFGDHPPSGVKSEYLATVVSTGTETYQVDRKSVV